jgi:hypothetical protein
MVSELCPVRAPGMAAGAVPLRPQISGYVALIVDLDLTLGSPLGIGAVAGAWRERPHPRLGEPAFLPTEAGPAQDFAGPGVDP